MRFYKMGSDRLVYVNTAPYKIKWDGKCRSKIQFAVKQFFKPFWHRHICFEELNIPGSRLKIDLLNCTLKIAVETNGNQHSEFNRFFHDNSRVNYLKSIGRDYQKLEWLEKNGYQLIEITEQEAKSLSVEFFKDKFNLNLV